MKITVFLATLFLGALTMSCQNDNLAPGVDTDFESVVLSAARYSVEADSATKAHCKGKLTEIDEADLPAAASAYIVANYADATLKFAGKGEKGNIVVALMLTDGTHKGLIFDSAGALVKELSRKYKEHAKLTRVAVADLPAAISGYAVANYPAATIKHAGTNEAGEYFVMLATTDKPVVLLFNADGTFSKLLEKPRNKGKRFHGAGGK